MRYVESETASVLGSGVATPRQGAFLRRSLLCLSCLSWGALAFGATPNPRVQLRLDCSEAEQVLRIVALREQHRTIPAAEWRRLFATEPYQRLKLREAAIGKRFNDPSLAFTDEDFKTFVLSPEVLKEAPALRDTLDRWKAMDLDGFAAQVLGYLPASAVIRAKVFPMVKPNANSFVWDMAKDPTIMLYLDAAVSPEKFVNTVAHELHHIGLSSAVSAFEERLASSTEPVRNALTWMESFGEGCAMLAAAGGPEVDPHAASTPEERARWQHDLANFERDLPALDAFFRDILSGKLSGDAVDEKGGEFFGRQGPWYTVGYEMAVLVERSFGRAALLETMQEPPLLLARYNQAAAEQNKAGKASWPLWSDVVLRAGKR